MSAASHHGQSRGVPNVVVRSRTSRIAHVLERVGLAMMGASRGLFVAVLLAKVGIEVLTFPVVTFAIMIYGAIGFSPRDRFTLGSILPISGQRFSRRVCPTYKVD